MKIIAIICAKIIIFIGKIVNKGSSMPGKIALKIDKNLVKKLKTPEKIIAVTGSSGKGSTSSMLAYVYRQMGYRVVHNSSGANLKAGITTMLLENCTLTGKVKGDVIIYEVDERFAKFIFQDLTPQYVIVTNITRDQPPRQGDFDLVYAEIKKALPAGTHLILNGDDPYLLKFNLNNEYQTTYYTLDKTEYSYENSKFKNLNLIYCPKCNTKLEYKYYHFETLGKYNCPNCDFTHPETKYHITNIDYENFEMTVDNEYKIKLQYDLLYCVYNTMAVYTTACLLGLDTKKVCEYISQMHPNSKMYNSYKYKNSEVYILNNKNENSTTFNQSLLFTERFNGSKTVLIGWKEISRRYNFDDLSWLYDIDFEILKNSDVEQIICVGPQAYDIGTRIKIAGFEKSKIKIFDTLNEAKEFMDTYNSKYIFAIVNFDYVEPFKTTFLKEEETK